MEKSTLTLKASVYDLKGKTTTRGDSSRKKCCSSFQQVVAQTA